MSKFIYNLTVGIDVSDDFSYVAIIEPNGAIHRKVLKINHNADGFNYLVEDIIKAA